MRATYKSSRETCLGVKQQRERDSHQVGSVVVDQGAESQSAPERAAHVGDAHVPVAGAVRPAPPLQSLDGGHRRANAAEESGLPVDAQQQQRRAEGSEPERSCVLFPPAEGARRVRDAPAAAAVAVAPAATVATAVGVVSVHQPSPTGTRVPTTPANTGNTGIFRSKISIMHF